jgi:hypothetical protein
VIRTIRILGYILLLAGFGVVAMGLFGIYLEVGFSGMLDLLGPLYVGDFLATVMTLAPGYLLLRLANWLEKRAD